MSVYGYIFLAQKRENLVTEEEQRSALHDYARTSGFDYAEILVEKDTGLSLPLKERVAGNKLVDRCLVGDRIITMKAEWILSSASAGAELLLMLRNKNIALYCMDLGQNISVDEKRRLIVSEGCAGIVQKILSALAVCESSRGGGAVSATRKSRRNQGKYLGGPVPFGWEVNDDKVLIENKAQQKVIQQIVLMREDRWSYRDISKKLKNEFDIQLSHAGVRRILESDKKKKEEIAGEKEAG